MRLSKENWDFKIGTLQPERHKGKCIISQKAELNWIEYKFLQGKLKEMQWKSGDSFQILTFHVWPYWLSFFAVAFLKEKK